ncbi:DUF2326 domain-containing protein [Bernardetia sp. ABR2-2B]|uniref:DUF2326 domain-containing protein n=1 Tax=Bernardetia sp. ABR2-2B TaxID=3127472 RepID=UPI0030CDAFBF
MVTLKRLYSTDNIIPSIEFHLGVNIILGEYRNKEGGIDNINGIGKSTIIRLIDYLLVGTKSKSYLKDSSHSFLKEKSILLDLKIDSKIYTIKRYIGSNEIYFSEINKVGIKYEKEADFKEHLWSLFFEKDHYEGFSDSSWFRRIIKFFIKDDKSELKRDNPVNFTGYSLNGNILSMYNMFLLGISNNLVHKHSEKSNELKEKQDLKSKITHLLEEEYKANIDEIQHSIDEKERDIARLEYMAENFDTHGWDENTESKVREIDIRIEELRNRKRSFKEELDEYEKGIELAIDIDVDKVKKMYGELNKSLAFEIKKRLDDIIEFRQNISKNRKSFLKKRLETLNEKISEIGKNILSLESEKQLYLGTLKDKKSFTKITDMLTKVAEEKLKLATTKKELEKLNQLEIDISEARADAQAFKTQIIRSLSQEDETVKKIRLLFSSVIKEIGLSVGSDNGSLDIKMGEKVTESCRINIKTPKEKSLGRGRAQLLAYDLTVFTLIIQQARNLPHFLCHDGILHSIDEKVIGKSLNYMHSLTNINPEMQYITTLNQNEIPTDFEWNFDIHEATVVKLSDAPDEMLFGQSYK